MSEQRIEQWWVSVKGELQGIYSVRKAAVDAASAFDAATIVHLVEIREGEEIVGPGLSASAFVLDDMRRERDAAIERAEKAEAKIADVEALAIKLGNEAMAEDRKRLNDIIGGLRGQIEWLIKEHVRECDELRAEKADERVRFERECAMRFRVADIVSRSGGPLSWSLVSARELADHYFGAKEA